MAPILHASACPQCGSSSGSCSSGETCLPDNYVAPCADGEECLPSDYIDPADCPALTPRDACLNLLGFGQTSGGYGTAPFVVSCLAPPDGAGLVVLAAYETNGTDTHPTIVTTDSDARTWADTVQAQGPDQYGLGGAIATSSAGVGDAPFTVSVEADTSTDIGSWRVAVYAVTCSDGFGTHDSLVTTKADNGGIASLTLTLADAYSRVIGFLASDQDDPPIGQSVTAGTSLLVSDPSFVFIAAATDAGDDELAFDVSSQQWDNDLVLAVEILGAADGGACTCAPDCPTCAECACSEDSYLPYCVSPNADDPDTVILALTPFAYYLMDSNGGVDATGNGHTATSSIGTVSYGVAAITSKAAEATALTAGGSITFPPPVADMGNPAQACAVAMVMQVDAYDSGAGGAAALDGGYPFLSWAGSSPPKMAHVIGGTGHLVPYSDSTFARLGNFVRSRDVLFGIGEPHVLILNAPTAVNALGTWEFWLDGVLVLTSQREGTGVDGSAFQVGRIAGGGPFFGALDMTFSNLATWDRALTDAEIKTVTEVLIDSTIIATAWDPSS